MALENTLIPTELFTKDNGKMINKMVQESKLGPTDKNIKANLIWESNQVKESSNLMMAHFIRETF